MDAADRSELIDELCSFEGRWPGTDAERRAANHLAGRLRGSGRRALVEPTYVHPEYALVIAAHLLLAIAGSLLALVIAPVGFVLVLFAAASLYLDLNTRLYLLRRLFFRRASQNVVSPGSRPSAPARLILSAHYDAAKTGFAFGPRAVGLLQRLPARARVLAGPLRLVFWGGIAPLLAISGIRLAGVDVQALDLLQLLVTAMLLVALLLLLDIWLSPVVPGAIDNASGVAAALAVTAALDAEPPQNLDVWVLLSGAEECLGEGMRSWVRAHRGELEPENTFVVNLDSVGFGTPAYQLSEGAIVSYPMDRRLVELCAAIADAGAGGGEPAVAAVRHPLTGDALSAQLGGLRSISIRGAERGIALFPEHHTHADTPDRVDPKSLTAAVDFALELARQIDRDVGRQVTR